MAMNFYGLLLEVRIHDILALAERIFGGCEFNRHGNVACDFRGRDLIFHYSPASNVVDISFYFQHDVRPMGTDVSAKDPSFGTGRELQAGSLAGVKKFKEFVKGLKDLGVSVTYSAGGRRRDLYARVMRQAGMEEEPFSRVWT